MIEYQCQMRSFLQRSRVLELFFIYQTFQGLFTSHGCLLGSNI